MHLKLLKKTTITALLTDYSILKVTGNDAQSFMHRQFTQNIESLNLNRCILSAYCHHTGTVLALFWIIRVNKAFYIIINRSNAPLFIRHLSRYILRDDVAINDVTDDHYILGLINDNNDFALNIGDVSQNENALIARVPNRCDKIIAIMIANRHNASNFNTINSLMENFKDNSLWHIYQIKSLFPGITDKTATRFTAKQLQLDSLGALSNNKGCFPGREVIVQSLANKNKEYELLQGFISKNESNTLSLDIKNKENKTVGFVLLTQKSDDNKQIFLATIEKPIYAFNDQSYFIDNQVITWIKN